MTFVSHLFIAVARWLLFPLAAYAVARLHARKTLPAPVLAVWCAAAALVGIGVVRWIVSATYPVAEWDFLCFWQYGHVALAHANVYDPASYRHLTTPVPINAEFVRESIDVGFPYPPPSILLFLPLGAFGNFTASSVVWIVVVLAIAAAGAIVLARSYDSIDPRLSIFAVLSLLFALPATLENVSYHQTNGIALALIVAAYALRDRPWGGVAAALAAIVKPYLIVVILWFALRRRWNAAIASVVTLVLAFAAALPFIGSAGVRSYALANPISRLPAWNYSEFEAASLYAALLRATHGTGSAAGVMHDLPYIGIAAILAVATALLIGRARPEADDLSLGLAVLFGLIVYPGSATMYAMATIPALVALATRARTTKGYVAIAALALVLFAATRSFGEATFFAYALFWIVLAANLVPFAVVRSTRSLAQAAAT